MKWSFIDERKVVWEADQAIELRWPELLPELRLCREDAVGAVHAYGDLHLKEKKRLPRECPGCEELRRMRRRGR